jgi:hypothetical protein
MGPIGPLTQIAGTQNFIDLANQGFPQLPPSIPIPGMNDTPLEFSTHKAQSSIIRETLDDDRRNEKNECRRDRENRDSRDSGRRL